MADAALVRTMRRNDRIAGGIILCILGLIGLGVFLQGRSAQIETMPSAPAGPAPSFQLAPALLRVYALGRVHSYNADNLYEYIDGQAPRYVQFGFKALAVGEYESRDKSVAPLVVDVYDMGNRRNAYGIFADSRPPEAEAEKLGNEGYISGNLTALWKGRFYLRVQAPTDKDVATTVRSAAQEVAGWIEDNLGGLAEFSAFPKEGLAEGSLTFQKEAAFGLGYLNDVFGAEYSMEGRNYKLLFADAGTPERALAILAEHTEFLAKNGKVENEALKGVHPGGWVWGQTKYIGPMLLRAEGEVVAGCIGVADFAEALRLTNDLLSRAAPALRKER